MTPSDKVQKSNDAKKIHFHTMRKENLLSVIPYKMNNQFTRKKGGVFGVASHCLILHSYCWL